MIKAASFNSNAWANEANLRDFWFKAEHVGLLAELLEFPGGGSIAKRSRCNASSIEATALLLRRLTSPARWSDLELTFGRSKSALSDIFLEALRHAHSFFSRSQDGFPSGLVESRADLCSRKMRKKGAPLDRCVGFMDGAGIKISRPSRGQRACRSGHKRCHALKYQSIVGPGGLFLHFWGSLEGRRHDMALCRRSGVDQILEGALARGGGQYRIYGDPAYV